MKRKRKQQKTDLELDVEIGLADAVEDGDVALAGTSADGEPQFKLTDKGKKAAEAVLRRYGVDPRDKAAVKRFLFATEPKK